VTPHRVTNDRVQNLEGGSGGTGEGGRQNDASNFGAIEHHPPFERIDKIVCPCLVLYFTRVLVSGQVGVVMMDHAVSPNVQHPNARMLFVGVMLNLNDEYDLAAELFLVVVRHVVCMMDSHRPGVEEDVPAENDEVTRRKAMPLI
jgi:hypothetical protein